MNVCAIAGTLHTQAAQSLDQETRKAAGVPDASRASQKPHTALFAEAKRSTAKICATGATVRNGTKRKKKKWRDTYERTKAQLQKRIYEPF